MAVGNYARSLTVSDGSGSSASSFTWTVTQKALTITAANQSKTYGESFVFDESTPTDDFTVAGLATGESIASVPLSSAGRGC